MNDESYSKIVDGVNLTVGNSIKFRYTNWRGETANRYAKIIEFCTGSTEWHPEKQDLIKALDLEKNEERLFAAKDMSEIKV